eukprot:3940277-Heterocapsa_arctica.AAC.1
MRKRKGKGKPHAGQLHIRIELSTPAPSLFFRISQPGHRALRCQSGRSMQPGHRALRCQSGQSISAFATRTPCAPVPV